jgi:signal transduction histidine kinase
MAETVAEPDREHLDVMMRAADQLVDWSDRARYVERALENVDAERRPIVVSSAVERAAQRVSGRFPVSNIVTPVESNYEVLAHSTLEWALYELIENAVEHGSTSPQQAGDGVEPDDIDEPTVIVSIEANGQTITISIADTGPGIPEEERAVLESGEETPLEHGSGLGLWLVSWTIRAAGGDIHFAENEPRGTRVSVTLPRAPS